MRRLSAEEFLAQVLDGVKDLTPELRRRLLESARLSPAARLRELKKLFQEASRG
jgi:hypothetical protein